MATVPGIQKLLIEERSKGMPVVYSVTRQANRDDIREELKPLSEERAVKGSSDQCQSN